MKYLDLIEAKTTGCFDLLDEESKLPTPRTEHFTMEVHNRNKGHPRLDVRRIIQLDYHDISTNCFLFSFRENQSYVCHAKHEMMKAS